MEEATVPTDSSRRRVTGSEGRRVDWKTSSINKPQEGVYNRLKGTMREATNKMRREKK